MPKMSMNVTDEEFKALQKMAAERGTSMTEVIRRALSNTQYLGDQARGGAQVIVRKSTGDEVELPEHVF